MNGLLTTQLDFGNQFTGDARWLELTVDCGGGAVTLTRQALAATPYALGLLPGAKISGAIVGMPAFEVDNNVVGGTNNAIQGITYNAGAGVRGYNGLTGPGLVGDTGSASSAGVVGTNYSSGPGVQGNGSSGDGVSGITSSGYAGVAGDTAGINNGVYGHANNSGGSGVYGHTSGSSVGVAGSTIGQSDAGPLTGGTYTLNGGFWNDLLQIGQPLRLYLPLIDR